MENDLKEPNLEIDDRRLQELFNKIKPIIKVGENNELYYIKDVDLRGASFLWSPEPTVKAENLVAFKIIKTYHKYGYYGMFKPSIAEVLAQIPNKYIGKCVAFEINSGASIIDKISCHVVDTTLYMKAK